MKKITLIALALLPLLASAQNKDEKPKEEPKVKAQLYGFVRNYGNFDSRQTYYVIGGEYNMIPKDIDHSGTDGELDLNAVPQYHLEALTTRVGLNLTGPGIWGATSSAGKIEADFGGFSTTNSVLRIRQAWCKLNWLNEETKDNQEVLVGQTWHPLSGDIMPEVLGMAAGAPFRPHSRTPMVRYQYLHHSGLSLMASAMSQLQYMNQGPACTFDKDKLPAWAGEASTRFAYNALLPEFFLGIGYKTKTFYTQVGLDYQRIRPRTFGVVTTTEETTDADGNAKTLYHSTKVSVDEALDCFTPTIYAQFTPGKLAIKFRTLLAQNTSQVNQLVGYGVTAVDPLTGQWEYAAQQASITYLNIAYGKTWRANLFLGYQENLGLANSATLCPVQTSSDPAKAPGYFLLSKGNYTNIQTIWRLCPGVSYNTKAFNIGLEYELTGVAYGDKTKMQPNGTFKPEDTHEVLGHRICALVKYNF